MGLKVARKLCRSKAPTLRKSFSCEKLLQSPERYLHLNQQQEKQQQQQQLRSTPYTMSERFFLPFLFFCMFFLSGNCGQLRQVWSRLRRRLFSISGHVQIFRHEFQMPKQERLIEQLLRIGATHIRLTRAQRSGNTLHENIQR